MSTLEQLFVEIFDRKRRIVQLLNYQKKLHDQHLASKLLIQGITPPPWLLNSDEFSPSFSSLSTSDPEAIDLIAGILLQHPPPEPSYSIAPSLNNKPGVSDGKSELPDDNLTSTCIGRKDSGHFRAGVYPQCLFGGPELVQDYVAESPLERTVEEVFPDIEQSLGKIQRSKSRQKALELRNSAKTGPKNLSQSKPASGTTVLEQSTKDGVLIAGRSVNKSTSLNPRQNLSSSLDESLLDKQDVPGEEGNIEPFATHTLHQNPSLSLEEPSSGKQEFPPVDESVCSFILEPVVGLGGSSSSDECGKLSLSNEGSPQAKQLVLNQEEEIDISIGRLSSYGRCINLELPVQNSSSQNVPVSNKEDESPRCSPKDPNALVDRVPSYHQYGHSVSSVKEVRALEQLVSSEPKDFSRYSTKESGLSASSSHDHSEFLNLPEDKSLMDIQYVSSEVDRVSSLTTGNLNVSIDRSSLHGQSGNSGLLIYGSFPVKECVSCQQDEVSGRSVSKCGSMIDLTSSNSHCGKLDSPQAEHSSEGRISFTQEQLSLKDPVAQLCLSPTDGQGRNSRSPQRVSSIEEHSMSITAKEACQISTKDLMPSSERVDEPPNYNGNFSWPQYKRKKLEFQTVNTKSASSFHRYNENIPKFSICPMGVAESSTRDIISSTDESMHCFLNREQGHTPDVIHDEGKEGDIPAPESSIAGKRCGDTQDAGHNYCSAVEKARISCPDYITSPTRERRQSLLVKENLSFDMPSYPPIEHKDVVGAQGRVPVVTDFSQEVQWDGAQFGGKRECSDDISLPKTANMQDSLLEATYNPLNLCIYSEEVKEGDMPDLERFSFDKNWGNAVHAVVSNANSADRTINNVSGNSTCGQTSSQKSLFEGENDLSASYLVEHNNSVETDSRISAFESFVSESGDAGKSDGFRCIDSPCSAIERAGLLEKICRSASMGIPLTHFSDAHSSFRDPCICRSVPNGVLENVHLGSNMGFNDDGGGRHDSNDVWKDSDFRENSYSESPFSPNSMLDWDFKRPYMSPVGKAFEGITAKFSVSNKRGSSNPELTCFPIEESSEEDMNITHNEDTGSVHNVTSLASCKETMRESSESVSMATIMNETNSRASQNTKHYHQNKHKRQGKENKSSSLDFKKNSESHKTRLKKSKLVDKSSVKTRRQSLSEKERKCNNIVSTVKSFIPFVQKKQAPPPAKKEVRVKALEAAEAAKRLAEKKEIERKQMQEARKLERVKKEQERQRHNDLAKKAKEQERMKKEAEMEARKRQREEDQKKEREKKKRRLKEVQNLQKAQDERMCDVGKEPGLRAEAVARNSRNLAIQPSDNGATGANSLEICGEKTPKNDESRLAQTVKELSYEISPYVCSDDEEEDDDEDRPNDKFVPTWTSKSGLAQALSSQQRLDPDVIFPRGSFCRLDEVLLPRRLQPRPNAV